MKRRKNRCEFESPTYRKLIQEKNNGKIIDNGIMIGNTHYLNKQNIICAL